MESSVSFRSIPGNSQALLYGQSAIFDESAIADGCGLKAQKNFWQFCACSYPFNANGN